MSRQVLKIHKITRQPIAIYKSASEAAKDAGIRDKRMRLMCNNKTLIPGVFYYRYIDDFNPNENFAGKQNCPVVLLDVVNGQHRWFGSMSECSQVTKWNRRYILNCINTKNALLGKRYKPVYIRENLVNMAKTTTKTKDSDTQYA